MDFKNCKADCVHKGERQEKECKGYIPMSNADRIRAMTDKEIAKLIVDAVSIGCPFKMDWSCEKEKDGWDACDVCWRKWLEQPAEGD